MSGQDRSAARTKRPAKTPEMVALLTEFALWASPVWGADNSDDREAAHQWVLHYLEGGDGP